jgi:hypothetical protein
MNETKPLANVTDVCLHCGHALVNNLHGPDQNDYGWNGENYVYLGACCYCRVCAAIVMRNKKGIKGS